MRERRYSPDIEIWWDTARGAAGRDPQRAVGVREALRLLEANPPVNVERPVSRNQRQRKRGDS